MAKQTETNSSVAKRRKSPNWSCPVVFVVVGRARQKQFVPEVDTLMSKSWEGQRNGSVRLLLTMSLTLPKVNGRQRQSGRGNESWVALCQLCTLPNSRRSQWLIRGQGVGCSNISTAVGLIDEKRVKWDVDDEHEKIRWRRSATSKVR